MKNKQSKKSEGIRYEQDRERDKRNRRNIATKSLFNETTRIQRTEKEGGRN
jgi:hypothetical protein